MTAEPPPTGPTLSALVVCHNEEDNLDDCLSALAFCDEIVVVLDRCTDRSAEIAGRYTDRLIPGAWPIEGDRRNTGLDACTGDWVLEVDADERIPPALAAEIRGAIASGHTGYFSIPVHNYVGSRLVRYGWGGSIGVNSVARLSRRGAKRWGRQRVHPRVTLQGERRLLTEPLAHEVDKNISDMIARLDRYTTARAQDLRESGDIGSCRRNVRRIFSRFWTCYVGRKGYREGGWGLLIALMAALYPILSYLKARLETEEAAPPPGA